MKTNKTRKLWILLFTLIAVLALSFTACVNNSPQDSTGGSDNKPEGPTAVAIQDIIKNSAADAEVTVEGVVYAKTAQGFFMADETGRIFVASSQQVEAGDKLSVTAKVATNKNAVSLTGATVNKTGTGTALTAQQAELDDVLSVIAGKANYYNYYAVSGVVCEQNGVYSLRENEAAESEVIINDADLEAWLGKKVDVNIVTVSYSTSWEALIVGEVVVHPVELTADLSNAIFAYVDGALAKSVWFELSLPTVYANEPAVEFAWTVESGSAISVENNLATVNEVTEMSSAALKLTLSCNNKTATRTYNVTVNYAATVSYAEAKELPLGTLGTVSGRVLAKGMSQTLDRKGILITDGNGNNLSVDIADKALLDAINLGDVVKAVGVYSTEGVTAGVESIGHLSAQSASIVEKAPADYSVDYSKLEAVEISSVAQYQELVQNAPANSNKLYKFVAPYMIYSGNTTYNFIRLGGNVAAGNGYKVGNDDWYYCFARNALAYTLGEDFEKTLDLPFIQSGTAKYYPAYTIYAYPMYAGGTTWQFIVPEMSAVVIDYNALAKYEIENAIGQTTIYANEAGTINLPTTTASCENITWTANPEGYIDLATGAYQAQSKPVEVTLTATYVLDGVSGSCDILLTFVAEEEKITKYTVTTWLEAAKSAEGLDENYELTAYVAAMGTQSNDAAESRNGIVLTDGVNTLWYRNAVYDSVDVKVGDVIKIRNAQPTTTDGNQVIVGGEYEVTSETNVIDYSNLNLYATISSDKELADLAIGMKTPLGGVVVKFTGEFYFVGTGSSPKNEGGCRYQLNYKDAKSSAAARYKYGDYTDDTHGNRTFAFSVGGNNYNIDKWYETLGLPEKSGSTSFKVQGTIYAVGCYYGATLHAWAIISMDCGPYVEDPVKLAEEEILALSATYDASEEGELKLPASTAHSGEITWSSESSLVDIANGTYAKVSEDTEVVLTATYTINGVQYTKNVKIMLQAAQIEEYTVSQWLKMAKSDDGLPENYILNAYVAAMGTTSGNAAEQRDGVILTDGVNTIWYKVALYETLTELAKGDLLNIKNPAVDVKDGNQIINGGTVELVSIGNNIDYSKLDLYTTISSETELTAFAAGLTPVGGIVVKFTGDFYLIGTGSSNCRWQLHYKGTSVTGSPDARYKYGDYSAVDNGNRTFSFSSKGNGYTFAKWWESCGVPENGSKTSYAVTGTIYAVACGYGKTMHAWSIIAIDCAPTAQE